jgi:hypothetical protein
MDHEWEHEAIDRRVLRDFERITSGSDFHHLRRPDELAILHEEGSSLEDERDALREEIFAASCDFALSGGPHPLHVMQRIMSLMKRFDIETYRRMGDVKPWWNAEEVNKVLQGYYTRTGRQVEDLLLHTITKKITEEDDHKFVFQSFKGLCKFLVSEGYEWKKVVAVQFSIVKALRPFLLGSMSLEDIAVLSGDSGRATVCARVKRLFNKRLEAQGMLGTFAHFQKSPESVERYRAAQRGNHNRNKNLKKA